MRKVIFVTLALVILFAMSAFSAGAQTPTPNQINTVARELWCPLCNGVRLDNCDLQACIQMREVIAQKLEAGESTASIKTYFVTQYGDVVLGQPPREGFNLIAYIFPILAAVVGVGWVSYLVLAWRRRQVATAPTAAGRGDSTRISTRKASEDADEYVKRVERELRETE